MLQISNHTVHHWNGNVILIEFSSLAVPEIVKMTIFQLSIWENFHHWLHWKLSKRQLPVQPVMKIALKEWRLCFSIGSHFVVFWWGGEWLISLMISEPLYRFADMRQWSNHGEDMGQLIICLHDHSKTKHSEIECIFYGIYCMQENKGALFEYFVTWTFSCYHIDGLVQERRNSIANALELRPIDMMPVIPKKRPSLLNCAHFLDEMERWSPVARG